MVQVVQQTNVTPSSNLLKNKKLLSMAQNVGLVTPQDRVARVEADKQVTYQDPTIEGLETDIAQVSQAEQIVGGIAEAEAAQEEGPASVEELANIMNEPVYTATVDEEAANQEALRIRNQLVPKVGQAAEAMGFKGIKTLAGLWNIAKATEAVGTAGKPFTSALSRIGGTAKFMADKMNMKISKAQRRSFLEQGSWKVAEAARAGDDGGITFGEWTPAENPMWKGDDTLNINTTNVLMDIVGAGAINEKGNIVVDPEFWNIMALNAEASFIESMYASDQEKSVADIVEQTATEVSRKPTDKDMIKFGIISPEPTAAEAEQEHKEYIVKKSRGLEKLGKDIYREYKQTRAAMDGLPTDSYLAEINDINKGVFTLLGSIAKEMYAAANKDLIASPPRTKSKEKVPVEFLIKNKGANKFEEMYRVYSGLFAAKEVKPQPLAGNNGIIAGEGTQITRRMTTFMGSVDGKTDYYGDTSMSFEAMKNQNTVGMVNDPQRTSLSTLFFMLGLGNGGFIATRDENNNPIPEMYVDGPNGQNFYADIFNIGKAKYQKLQAEKRALEQNVRDLEAVPENRRNENAIKAARQIAENYRPATILRLERQKAINIQEAMLRWGTRKNHLTYALQLLTGRMHAQQTLYNPQAHKQIRQVVSGGNKYNYVPGTMGKVEKIWIEGMVANLFEDPKVSDPNTNKKMMPSWKKEKGFRMPSEERIKLFQQMQKSRGEGGLWDQYVAWGKELKQFLNIDKQEAKTYLHKIKHAKNNTETKNIGNTLKQRYGNDPISPRLKAYLADFEQDGIHQADFLIALADYDRVAEYNKANPNNKIKFTDTQVFEIDGKTHGPGTMGMQFGSVSMAKRSDMIMDLPLVEKIQSEEYRDLRDAMASTMIDELNALIESGKLAGTRYNPEALQAILDNAIADRENFLKKSPMTMGYGQALEALKRHVEKTVYQSDKIRQLISDNQLGMQRTIDFLHTMMVDSIFQNMDPEAIQAMDTLKSVGWQSVLLNEMIEIPQPTGIKAFAAGQEFEEAGNIQWKAPNELITESGIIYDPLYEGKASAQALRHRQDSPPEIGGWTVSRILASLIQAYDASMATGVFTNTRYNHNGGPPLNTGNWNKIIEEAKANGSNVKEVINKKTGKKEFIGQPFVFQNFDAFVGDSGTIGIVRDIANDIHKNDIINEDAASKVFNWYHTKRKEALKKLSQDDSTYQMLAGGMYIEGGSYMKVAEIFSGDRFASKNKPNPYKNLTKFIKKNINVPWERKKTGESLAKWKDRKDNIARNIAYNIEKELGSHVDNPLQMSRTEANQLSLITGKSEAELLAKNKKDLETATSYMPKDLITIMHSTGKLTGKQIYQMITVINNHLNLDSQVQTAESNIRKGKNIIRGRLTKRSNNIDFG